jgi:hypothetical protein
MSAGMGWFEQVRQVRVEGVMSKGRGRPPKAYNQGDCANYKYGCVDRKGEARPARTLGLCTRCYAHTTSWHTKPVPWLVNRLRTLEFWSERGRSTVGGRSRRRQSK